jgi:predicted DNA-binding protein
MPTKNPRLNVILEKGLYSAVKDMAEHEGISKSMAVRDLVKEALELREDVALAGMAEEREKTFNPDNALSHDEVWG